VIKKLIHIILTVTMLAALGYVLWIGVHKQQEKAEEAAEEAPAEGAAVEEEEKPEGFVVMLDNERAEALGVEKEQPKHMMMQARRIAFGSVMDPTPLLALDGDLAVAETAFNASKSEHDRTMALMATADASKKTAEAALAQYTADKIKVDSLIRGAQLQWGSVFTAEPAKRHALIDELIAGGVALVRVDIMAGETLPDLPKKARVVVMGREDQAFDTSDILPATSTDAKTQAQGFVLRINKPPFALRPGMALTAWMELPEKPRPGYAIPRSAVLRHDGRTWVFVQEEAEKYVRTAITLDAPLQGDQGWFITENAGLTAEDVIVVTGAASILSEELKAQGGEPE
jgi:membrane fusion protein, multidrug efflux system